MKHRPLPSLKVVSSLFDYDPVIGILISKTKRKNWTPGPKSGYATVRIEGYRYNISRVCWLLATGEDPGDFEVDHINRDCLDNRLSNLRLATRSQQLANRSRTSAASLPKGVTFNPERSSYGATWGKMGSNAQPPDLLPRKRRTFFIFGRQDTMAISPKNSLYPHVPRRPHLGGPAEEKARKTFQKESLA
jgi:hypothetical protein